jgi:hypothetical protein
MTKPLIQIGDEVREMTDDEHADYIAFSAELEAQTAAQEAAVAAEQAAKESARAKLAALGLTDEEVAALTP